MLRRIILYRASKNKNINMLDSFSFVNIGFAFLCIISCGCKKTESVTSSSSSTVPAVYSKIYGATSITSDGTYITIKSNHLPDYKSVYYPTTDSMYQSFSGITFNGYTFSKINMQDPIFRLPMKLAGLTNIGDSRNRRGSITTMWNHYTLQQLRQQSHLCLVFCWMVFRFTGLKKTVLPLLMP